MPDVNKVSILFGSSHLVVVTVGRKFFKVVLGGSYNL